MVGRWFSSVYLGQQAPTTIQSFLSPALNVHSPIHTLPNPYTIQSVCSNHLVIEFKDNRTPPSVSPTLSSWRSQWGSTCPPQAFPVMRHHAPLQPCWSLLSFPVFLEYLVGTLCPDMLGGEDTRHCWWRWQKDLSINPSVVSITTTHHFPCKPLSSLYLHEMTSHKDIPLENCE